LLNSGETRLTMPAEVSANAQGELKDHRIVANDPGHVVNPDTCRAQAESCTVSGQGAVLYQENNLKNGRIVEWNLHDFTLPTMAGCPRSRPCSYSPGGFWRRRAEPAMLALAPAAMQSLAPPESACARRH
jgi:isoquinoline 1-oxidoreductase beta subunit